MAKIATILEWFAGRGNRWLGKPNLEGAITAPRAVELATKDHITFIGAKLKNQFADLIQSAEASLIIVEGSLLQDWDEALLPEGKAIVVSSDAKVDMIAFCAEFLDFEAERAATEIHPTAVIGEGVKLGRFVKIGPYVHLEAGCVIGDYCQIGSGTHIANTELGKGVIIGSNTSIGGNGFGFSKLAGSEEYAQFPHYGRVIIADRVSIGSNTCIDRGSLKDTLIGPGVKIDNLVHIAHNVEIGANSLIIACAMIAGSTIIGENVWVAPGSSVRNALRIGSNAIIGLAATVTKDVSEGQTVMGSPAVDQAEFVRVRKVLGGMGRDQ